MISKVDEFSAAGGM